MINPYDELAYPSGAFGETHPDRMAAQAMAFGLSCPAVNQCRVLEIGAGDGSNLIPMAMGLPGSRFVGFDLAGDPIRRGQAVVRALGLDNIDLLQADARTIDLGDAPFDYIIAHGVYSWTGEDVREAVMRLIGQRLSPHGVAFVSYNTLPGCHVRLTLREDLLFHSRDAGSRADRLAAAMDRLRVLADPPAPADGLHRMMAEQAKAMLRRPPASLAHDELTDAYHPVHMQTFDRHCADHGLAILTDAEPGDGGDWFLAPEAAPAPATELIVRLQAKDFGQVRLFRRSLLVRDDVVIDRRADAENIAGLHAASPARRNPSGGFDFPAGQAAIRDPDLAAVLDRLGPQWPLAAPVADLAQEPRQRAGLMRLYLAGFVALHAEPSPFVLDASDRPEASRLARLQAGEGQARLTTLRHTLEAVDERQRGLIQRLDGRRTRRELAEADAHADLDQALLDLGRRGFLAQ